MTKIKKVKKWAQVNEEPDYSKQKCSNCNLFMGGECDLELQDSCVTATNDLSHNDYWIGHDDEE